MKLRQTLISVFSLGVLSLMAGCQEGGEPTPEQDKKLKDAFKQEKFDINQVPPEHRDKVKGFMEMGKKPPTAGGGASKQ
ncbi:MAG: hypothetical protein SFX74_10410 [Fimbriimonadaceae bacterium]|nr:hypothetical protein [Fimbriimonadaceae bacterium]